MELLEKLGLPAFCPLPLIENGRRQTIAAVYFPYNPFIGKTHSHQVELEDGDKLVITENCPVVERPSRRIALLIHGLTGSDQSRYLIRMTKRLLTEGYHVFRMNLRGCGPGKGLAKNLYHSGRSEDARAVLNWLKTKFPNQPVTQVGFSLGANITLKMAGEDGNSPSANLDSLVAISPPLDLYSAVKLIIKRQNHLFNQNFMKGLLKDVHSLHLAYPDLKRPDLSNVFNVYEFDDIYTAPRSGFKSALDYYTQCSSKQYIDNIQLPTFLLHAKDDPVIARRSFLKLQPKPNFDILITQHGGHVGWLGYTNTRFNYRWMDEAIVKWINWFDVS